MHRMNHVKIEVEIYLVHFSIWGKIFFHSFYKYIILKIYTFKNRDLSMSHTQIKLIKA